MVGRAMWSCSKEQSHTLRGCGFVKDGLSGAAAVRAQAVRCSRPGAALLSGPCLSYQPGASVPGGRRWLKSHGMGLSAMGLTGGIRYVFGLYEAMERPLAVVTLV